MAGIDAEAYLSPANYQNLDLIKYKVEEEPQSPTFIPPEREIMYANGEDSQEFTIKAVTKAKLLNTADENREVQVKEAGKKDVLFTVDIDIQPKERFSTNRLQGETEGLPLMTDEKGYASFTYTTPEVNDPEFKGAEITFTADADDERVKGNPDFSIDLAPIVGQIKGRLVNLDNGKDFRYKATVALAYPPGEKMANGKRVETQELKGGTGEFVFETQSPVDDYTLIVRPDCPGDSTTADYKYKCHPRRLIKLPYNTNLGDIVVGTLKEYEQEYKRHIQDLFKGSGYYSLLGDLSLIHI